MKRPNRNGRRWALLRHHEIPHPTRYGVLIERYRLIQTPWFGLYLHGLTQTDTDRFLHDHPWTFTTLILRGGYTEEWAPDLAVAQVNLETRRRYQGKHKPLLGEPRTWRPGSIHTMHLSNYHRVSKLFRSPTWTLVVVGPRRQKWGYATEDGWQEADTNQAENPARVQ